MVPFKLQIILMLFSLSILFMIINMIRRYSLELKYSLLWFGLNLLIIVLIMFPDLLALFSLLIGIETPSNTLFLFGIFALFVIVFSLTVALSRSSNKIKEMTQEIGLLKQQFEDLNKKNINN